MDTKNKALQSITHLCAQKDKSISEPIKFPTLLEAIERVVELSKDSNN